MATRSASTDPSPGETNHGAPEGGAPALGEIVEQRRTVRRAPPEPPDGRPSSLPPPSAGRRNARPRASPLVVNSGRPTGRDRASRCRRVPGASATQRPGPAVADPPGHPGRAMCSRVAIASTPATQSLSPIAPNDDAGAVGVPELSIAMIGPKWSSLEVRRAVP